MSGFEWFLLVVVVIMVPLIVAVMVTLWTLEQARKRNRKNREAADPAAGPVKRKATRDVTGTASGVAGTLAVEEAVGGAAVQVGLADDALAAPGVDETLTFDDSESTTLIDDEVRVEPVVGETSPPAPVVSGDDETADDQGTVRPEA